MIFFDYLYYRFYYCTRNREKAGRMEAWFTSSCAISMMIFMLTLWIWADLCYLFYFDKLDKSLVIIISGVITYICIFFRYYNKIDELENKFKKSKMNKYISDYFLWLFILVFSAIGIGLMILSLKWLQMFFIEGELFDLLIGS